MNTARESPSAREAWPDPAALVAATRAHALEVREVAAGLDIVEEPEGETSLVREGIISPASARAATAAEIPVRERLPTAFDSPRMLLVRSWRVSRLLEPDRRAAALVAFPRTWCTHLGRSCRIASPGAGSHGLLRARPSFL